MKRILALAAVSMGLLLCGWPEAAEIPPEYDGNLVKAARAEGKLVIYSAMRRPLGMKLVDRFQKRFGIKVDFTRKTTGAIVQMIEAERLAKVARFDITGPADESVVRRWMKQGFLEPYRPANAKFIPPHLVTDAGYVNYAWLSVYVIAYNKKKVSASDLPATWKDAANPRWRHRIALADPKTAAGARIFLDIAADRYGWDYFHALGKNAPLLVSSIAALPRMLSSGEADLALVASEADILEMISKGEPFGVVYPEDFIPATNFAIAMRKNAAHSHAARLWLEFELSMETQQIYADSGRLSLREGVKFPFERPPLKSLKMVIPDPDRLDARRNELLKKFTETLCQGRP